MIKFIVHLKTKEKNQAHIGKIKIFFNYNIFYSSPSPCQPNSLLAFYTVTLKEYFCMFYLQPTRPFAFLVMKICLHYTPVSKEICHRNITLFSFAGYYNTVSTARVFLVSIVFAIYYLSWLLLQIT